MRSRPLAPVELLAATSLVVVAMAILVLLLASGPNWLGLSLAYDAKAGAAVVKQARGPSAAIPAGARLTTIAGGGDEMSFVADDFTIEPAASIATFANLHIFLGRQTRLSHIQDAPQVTLGDAQGRSWTVTPAPTRPLGSLPPDYWVQLVVGVVAWLISSWIWVFRRAETSARYLLLSGWATLMFASLAAVYSTRELALPGLLFRTINDLNFLGGSLFAASLASLLLYYPRKIAPRWVGLAIVGLFIVWWGAQEVGLFQSMVIARRALVLLAVGATFVLAGVQWRLTRADPIARAALQWFLLSWLVVVSIFVTLIFLPQIFGVNTSALQGYGFSLFLLVYVGLAFGIIRFRLFDLGDWWVRVVVWTASVLALVLLDLLFVLELQLSAGNSLALALLICGLVWLPLRGWVWGRVFGQSQASERALFQSVVEVGLTGGVDEQLGRWRAVLQGLFDPLQIHEAMPGTAAAIIDDGLALTAPAVDNLPALRLEYARGGRRLFNRRDLALVGELASMLAHVIDSRNAQQKGASIERNRIASDIHDNVGARLLSALHTSGGPRKDDLIRETLADLRSIINDATRPDAPLGQALASLRRETAERLGAQGVTLDWPPDEETAVQLAGTADLAIRSIVREAVSNVLKHAGARTVRVGVVQADGALRLSVEDDGVGFDPTSAASGNGLTILRRRVEARGGTLELKSDPGRGTRLSVELPLADAGAGA